MTDWFKYASFTLFSLRPISRESSLPHDWWSNHRDDQRARLTMIHLTETWVTSDISFFFFYTKSVFLSFLSQHQTYHPMMTQTNKSNSKSIFTSLWPFENVCSCDDCVFIFDVFVFHQKDVRIATEATTEREISVEDILRWEADDDRETDVASDEG